MAEYQAGLHKEVTSIFQGVWDPAIDNIEQNSYVLDAFTQEPTTDDPQDDQKVIDFGRSYRQVERYIEERELISSLTILNTIRLIGG